MQSATTIKSQVTIPKPIRDQLGLKPADKVKFFVPPNGSVTLLPTRPASSLRGMLKNTRQRAVTIEEMREAVLTGADKLFRRSR